jgi:hypothetical protein
MSLRFRLRYKNSLRKPLANSCDPRISNVFSVALTEKSKSMTVLAQALRLFLSWPAFACQRTWSN